VVGHAGAALLRELADRVGLTKALGWRDPQGRRHPDAAVLRHLAVMLADGGDCLSDLAVLRDQPALLGPVASTPTAWQVLERVASDPDGLARLRAARAHARARTWAAGGDPDVELLVIDADATLVLAHSDAKEGAAGTYRGRSGSRRCWPTSTTATAAASPWLPRTHPRSVQGSSNTANPIALQPITHTAQTVSPHHQPGETSASHSSRCTGWQPTFRLTLHPNSSEASSAPRGCTYFC
jgi:hypothetical protein